MPEIVDAAAQMGAPDGLERLWTPHRLAYVRTERDDDGNLPQCPFCAGPNRSDADALIVYRGDTCFVALNLFPYSPGHLLICTYRHVGDMTELTDDELDELGRLSRQAMTVLRRVSRPHGFNLGMNQGAVAGAGIPGHLHCHVVPRWAGDANFFPIIAQTKAVPQLLSDTRALVAAAWAEHE